MSEIVIAILLALAVLSAWIGCWGFVRLPTALDRLHCAAFVNAAGGFFLTVAVVVQDGARDRTLKMLFVLAILLLAGAALSHAAGRALASRAGGGG